MERHTVENRFQIRLPDRTYRMARLGPTVPGRTSEAIHSEWVASKAHPQRRPLVFIPSLALGKRVSQ